MRCPTGVPFTEDGYIEAETKRFVPKPLEEAWREAVDSIPGLSEEDRARALDSRDLVSPPGSYRVGFHLSKLRRVVAVQGGWWYRGVTCAESDAGGTRISYTVVNVAPGFGRWIAHLFQARAVRRNLKTQSFD